MEATTEVVSDRKYKAGQGYAMTRTVKACRKFGPPVHTLRVVVIRGNRDDYTGATVDRWDGAQWHRVVSLVNEDVDVAQAPSYVCWDHDRPVNGRADCNDWLDRVGDRALAHALDVVL